MRRGKKCASGVQWLACGAILVLTLAGRPAVATAAELADELKASPYQIVFETYRDGNWNFTRPDPMALKSNR